MNDEFRKIRDQPTQSLRNIPALGRVLMVGAVPDADGRLSMTDSSLLRYGLEPLRDKGLPILPDEQLDVTIMNKAAVFGGRDFLTEEGVEADIVILCNIAHKFDQEEYASTQISLIRSYLMSLPQLGHHELSQKHWEPGIWAQKIKETRAKIVMSYGVDSMPLEEVTPDGYFQARQVSRSDVAPKYLLNQQFVIELPFSQWPHLHPALNRFLIDTQFNDMPVEVDTEPGPG